MVVARDRDSMLEFGLLVGSLQLRILARNQVGVDRECDKNADPMLPDDASRGVTAKAFFSGERWFKGPNFLREPETNWLNSNQESYTMMDNDPELKKTFVTFTLIVIQNEDPLTSFIEKLSSWDLLKMTNAWILKFKSLLGLPE